MYVNSQHFVLFLFLLPISVINVLEFDFLQYDTDHDEDEFGEYDEFESGGYAQTAMPYIPDPESEEATPKSSHQAKSAIYDDDEFEGVTTGTMEFEKEATFSTSQDCMFDFVSLLLGIHCYSLFY